MQILKKAYVLLSGILFFLMMLPFVKGLMLLYAFGVMFMAIIEYAMHTSDMSYQITKAIVVNAVVWFLFLMYYYGLFVPKNYD
jgi:hypothetical protein